MDILPIIRELTTKYVKSTQDPRAQMSFADLHNMRKKAGANQNELGPYDHRAYASEAVQADPYRMVPFLAAAIPTYTGMKALGLTNARSNASLDEIGQGYAGIIDGLRNLSR